MNKTNVNIGVLSTSIPGPSSVLLELGIAPTHWYAIKAVEEIGKVSKKFHEHEYSFYEKAKENKLLYFVYVRKQTPFRIQEASPNTNRKSLPKGL